MTASRTRHVYVVVRERLSDDDGACSIVGVYSSLEQAKGSKDAEWFASGWYVKYREDAVAELVLSRDVYLILKKKVL